MKVSMSRVFIRINGSNPILLGSREIETEEMISEFDDTGYEEQMCQCGLLFALYRDKFSLYLFSSHILIAFYFYSSFQHYWSLFVSCF